MAREGRTERSGRAKKAGKRSRRATYHIGTSGYSYDDWKGRFYPEGLKSNEWLEYYAGQFSTVELNVTFYRNPTEKMIQAWNRRTPRSFRFAVKGSRRITHFKRLLDVGEELEYFWSLVQNLSRLRVLLWQFPPSFRRDDERLDTFLKILPRGVRHAFEFRHESWFADDVYDLLGKYRSSFVSVSHPKLPDHLVTSGKMAYLRFHGIGREMYKYDYTRKELKAWADRLRKIETEVTDIYVYFNNDYNANAIRNAALLKSILS